MLLHAESITHAFDPGRPVLDGVAAGFEPGTLTVILGPNGAGKTTLLRILGGLLKPNAGSVRLNNRPLRELPPRERATRLAYVPQRPEVGFGYSVAEVIGFGRFAAGESGATLHAAVEQALAAVDLTDRAQEPFLELSVGQQQRAVLGRALAQLGPTPEGAVLLADEPVSAMDPAHVQRSMQLIRAQVDAGLAAVLILHDPTLARRTADRGLVLNEAGRVEAHDDAAIAITPEVLSTVFGVGFTEVSVDGSPAILPLDPLGR